MVDPSFVAVDPSFLLVVAVVVVVVRQQDSLLEVVVLVVVVGNLVPVLVVVDSPVPVLVGILVVGSSVLVGILAAVHPTRLVPVVVLQVLRSQRLWLPGPWLIASLLKPFDSCLSDEHSQ